MSRETLTLFTVFFLIIFTFGSAIVLGGETEDLSFWEVLHNAKDFFVDVPLFGTIISALIIALVVYVLYREVRGGL